MAMVSVARATEPAGSEGWIEIDDQLRSNRTKRSGLDAHEMYWLREAERVQIWKPLGMVSMLDYMDRALGQNPETARKRLRVARALADLPEISAALESGELTFCAVRELTRVATSATERAWREAAKHKSSREIEDLVFGRRPGDLPEDPADPEVATRVLRFEVSGATYALLRETRLFLDEQYPTRLDDDQLIAALCERARDGGGDATTDGRAKFQIALTVCPQCDRAAQTGAGARIPVDSAMLARARCDAQHIGSLEGDGPERAHQDIPPSVARFVWARDHGRCQTPGCRSARGLEIHHIVAREHGGSHEPCNLTLRCSACHSAHHAGTLTISGTAPDQIVTTRNVRSEPRAAAVASPVAVHRRPAPAAPMRELPERAPAIQALCGLGWKRGVATTAVDEALGHVAHGAPVEEVIREALRRCPRRSG